MPSPQWHAILDNFRPVTVWMVALFIYYTMDNDSIGERWTRYSWLQFAGMLMLFFGTAVYNKNVKLPGLTYSTEGEEEGTAVTAADSGAGGAMLGQLVFHTPSTRAGGARGTDHLKSPALTRSPYFVASVKAHTAAERGGLAGMETSPYLRVHRANGAGSMLLSPSKAKRRTQSFGFDEEGAVQLSPNRRAALN